MRELRKTENVRNPIRFEASFGISTFLCQSKNPMAQTGVPTGGGRWGILPWAPHYKGAPTKPKPVCNINWMGSHFESLPQAPQVLLAGLGSDDKIARLDIRSSWPPVLFQFFFVCNSLMSVYYDYASIILYLWYTECEYIDIYIYISWYGETSK